MREKTALLRKLLLVASVATAPILIAPSRASACGWGYGCGAPSYGYSSYGCSAPRVYGYSGYYAPAYGYGSYYGYSSYYRLVFG